MNIYVNGDSWTYGYEVDDKTKIWPHIVAKEFNLELINESMIGLSNELILDKTLKFFSKVNNTEDYFVIIVWSYPIRKDIINNDGKKVELRAKAALEGESISLDYYTKYHSEYDDYLRYIRNVLGLQHYFKLNKIKYLMFDVERNTYFNKAKITESDKEYFDLIDSKNFIGDLYSVSDGNLAEGGHPNELGHEKIYKYMYPFIKNKIEEVK